MRSVYDREQLVAAFEDEVETPAACHSTSDLRFNVPRGDAVISLIRSLWRHEQTCVRCWPRAAANKKKKLLILQKYPIAFMLGDKFSTAPLRDQTSEVLQSEMDDDYIPILVTDNLCMCTYELYRHKNLKSLPHQTNSFLS